MWLLHRTKILIFSSKLRGFGRQIHPILHKSLLVIAKPCCLIDYD